MTDGNVNSYTLDNGLRVVHREDKSTPNIAFDIIYDVGSRDEAPDLTGIAHLFEHLMFGGSPNVPRFDHELELAGGWSNAWTSSDFTNFYDVLPAINAETAFWIESDRMKELLFSESALQTQRSVVIEEFKQTTLNQPYGDLSHFLLPLIYQHHPYSTPVIGKEIAHIERITNADIRKFFYSHYGPNNAVLSITGNISFQRVVELSHKWFEDIPPIKLQSRVPVSEPEIIEPRRLTVHSRVPYPRIIIAFHMTGRDDRSTLEYEAADIITDILSLGRSSRFYRNLIVPGIFSIADASIFGSRDTGYLMIMCQIETNTDEAIRHAEQRIIEELNQLTNKGISEDELEKAVNKLITRMEANDIGFLSKAQTLAVNTMSGLTNEEIISRYKTLTPRIILETGRKIIDFRHSATLIYRPE